jgi:hypothetical protein
MSILYVTEFQNTMPNTIGVGQASIAIVPPLAEQFFTISGSSAQSSAFNANTKFVRLHTDVSCTIEFGTNPTAVALQTARMAANQTEYFGVPQGASYKVAAVTSA